jgi:DNA-binding transcriptional ArsR family regulator
VPLLQITDQSANVFRAIADPTRRALLDLLRQDKSPALKLAEQFDLTQPAVSQHLKVLRQAGLVRERRDGRLRIYELEARPLREVRDWVSHYEQFWERKLDALGRHLSKKHGKKKR